jgi:hypothetical protein
MALGTGNVIGGAANAGLTGTSVAAAGTTQATATQLYAEDNEVSTVASGSGVVMNALIQPGEVQTVFNVGANALKVYPPSGLGINALSANTAISLATNTGLMLKCVSTTRIFGVLSA